MHLNSGGVTGVGRNLHADETEEKDQTDSMCARNFETPYHNRDSEKNDRICEDAVGCICIPEASKIDAETIDTFVPGSIDRDALKDVCNNRADSVRQDDPLHDLTEDDEPFLVEDAQVKSHDAQLGQIDGELVCNLVDEEGLHDNKNQ